MYTSAIESQEEEGLYSTDMTHIEYKHLDTSTFFIEVKMTIWTLTQTLTFNASQNMNGYISQVITGVEFNCTAAMQGNHIYSDYFSMSEWKR